MNSPGPRPLVANLLVAALCLIWGSTWFVIKIGLEDLPPFTSVAVRFVIATAGMAVVAAALHRREGGKSPPLWLSAVMGLSQFSISYGIVYWCETRLPSGLVSVLWGTFPLMMAAAGHRFLGERVRPLQVLGFLVGFGGVVLLYVTDIGAMGSEAQSAAAILLLSPLIVCVGTVVVKRHGHDVSSVLLNRDGMLVGTVVLLVVAFLAERDAPQEWTGAAMASVLYLALVGTVVTFGLYFWLLRYEGAVRLSVIAYVTPAVALVFGAAFLSESLDGPRVFGTGLVLLGVWLAHGRAAPTSEGG